MRTLLQSLTLATLTLAGSTAWGTDFKPLMDVATTVWSEEPRIGVLANYQTCKADVDALAAAIPGGRIFVVDVRRQSQLYGGVHRLARQVKPDYVVILPTDPMLRGGSLETSRCIGLLALRGIPTIATSATSIQQGAVFALGEDTGMQLRVTDHLRGTISVILPKTGSYLAKLAKNRTGRATVTVLSPG